MKSLKIKKVVLKDPHLRRLRSSLRILLRLAVKKKNRKLDKLEDLYLQKEKLTPSQRNRKNEISKLKNKLMYLSERSSCITCNEPYCVSHKDRPDRVTLFDKFTWFEHRSTNLDLVWVPWVKRWVCLQCFNYYYKNMTLNDFIDSQGEFFVIFDKDRRIEKDLRQKFRNVFSL